MNELALFAGAGGGILGGHLAGRNIVCAVERDAYAAQVLAQRQNDGILKAFPIWSDVTTFDARPWRGIVDVVSGGFPCQDISAAGPRAGLDGARSGLWSQFKRIIGDADPEWVKVENSPMLTIRGLGIVLGDLASLGFDAEWGIVSAADMDAPHLRERIWIMAHSNRVRQLQPARSEREQRVGPCQRSQSMANTDGEPWLERRQDYTAQGSRGWDLDRSGISKNMADAVREREQGIIAGCIDAKVGQGPIERQDRPRGHGFGRWPAEPGMGRVADGVANRVDRIKALGNGQVPRVVAAAWEILRR